MPDSQMMTENWQSKLKNDNIILDVSKQKLSELVGGMPVDSKFSSAIVVDGKIQFVCSDIYDVVKNEDFFLKIEEKLIDTDVKYVTRSINRQSKHFAVDYILNDPTYHVAVHGSKDELVPMIRANNSYAGGTVGGRFGFFRKMCSNGLHLAQMKLGFNMCHRHGASKLVLPKMDELIQKFMDNEYYTLKKKFEVLAETPILDLSDFVRFTATKMDLFRFEASKKTPNEPSKKAQIVMDTIRRESAALETEPNLWLGYNAFNELIHSGNVGFAQQRSADIRVFNTILDMAN